MRLHFGQRLWPGLVELTCPQDPVPFEELLLVKPLRQVVYQIPPSEEAVQQQSNALPAFGIVLGMLTVRTNFRLPKDYPEDLKPYRCPSTEFTDYQVVLDVESEAMPLWIMCSRRTLQERHDRWSGRKPNLPIFRGLMGFEKLGYDAACILDSVHRLADPPSFQEACDLVQRMRAVVDPGLRDARLAKMEELIGGYVPVGVHSSDV